MDKIKEVSELIKETINEPDSLADNMKNLKYLHKQLEKHITKLKTKQINTIKQSITTDLLNYAKQYTNINRIKKDMTTNNSSDDVVIKSESINEPELYESSVYDELADTIDYDIEELDKTEQKELIKKYQNIRNDIIEGLNRVNAECDALLNYKPDYQMLHKQIDILYHLHLNYIKNVSTGIKTPYNCSINGVNLKIQTKQTDFIKMAIDSFILKSL